MKTFRLQKKKYKIFNNKFIIIPTYLCTQLQIRPKIIIKYKTYNNNIIFITQK